MAAENIIRAFYFWGNAEKIGQYWEELEKLSKPDRAVVENMVMKAAFKVATDGIRPILAKREVVFVILGALDSSA